MSFVQRCFTCFFVTVLFAGPTLAGDPLNVSVIGHWDGGPCRLVTSNDDVLYVARPGEGGLYVVDISDPTNPASLGTVNPQIDIPAAIVLEETLAFVINAYPDLHILDITNPASPVQLSTWQLPGSASAMDIAIDGDIAYVTVHGGHGPGGVSTMDVSDPEDPTLIASVQTGTPVSIATNEGFAYTVDGNNLLVIDATDPEQPTTVAELAVGDPGYIVDVFLRDDLIYAVYVNWDTGAALFIVDVSDPYTPQEIGSVAFEGGPYSIHVVGSYAYVAADFAGLRVIDVSDATSPIEVGYLDTAGQAFDVSATEDLVYLADWTGLWVLRNDLLVGVESETPAATPVLNVFPNPFNPITNISFTLDRPQRARLSVFDPTGRLVAVVADRVFAAGDCRVEWNGLDATGRAVPSGMYLVHLDAGDLRETRQITLAR